MNSYMTEHLYNLICKLPRYNYETPRNQLPHNGVYIFYERGQTLNINNCVADKIVRIGTHKKDNRFRRRMREHFGNVSSLKGNKNGSVFRKHLGGALLRKDNPEDPRLKVWLTQDGPSFLEVEEAVSSVLRNNFTFSCFQVNRP